MADDATDIGQLTETQQLALQQYISVTDQDPAAALPLLRRCEWNAQPASTSPEAVADLNPPPAQAARRQETLVNSFNYTGSSILRTQLDPAPRITTAPQSQSAARPPMILSLLFTPVNILYSLFSRLFSVFGYLFPFLPRLLTRLTTRASAPASQRSTTRRPLGPQDTTARFLREFDEEYGSGAASKLPFLETGYARAYDLAKRELKFLVVIPLSPEHEDTPSFVRDTLLSDTVIAFFADPEHADKLLLWAGPVQDSEAYQVATGLNISRFPAAVLVAHTPAVSSTAMSVIARIAGPTSPADFTATLQAGMLQHESELSRVRATRSEQQASRDLREQQNSAYERSLATDRERARQRRQAEEEKEHREREELQRAQREADRARNLSTWKRWRAARLAAEPGPDVKDAVRVNVRILDGERVTRRFAADAGIEEIYAFVECHDVLDAALDNEKATEPPADFDHQYAFRIVSPMPREVYDVAKTGTLKEMIGRSATLIAEKIEDGEGDD
ncbi:hypothetical protein FH972_026550 [Carpinus fangiana]|uniref:UBX domain-containing protein n=1 Tax=Carpinus fangiana TaxID=176857 RepID=A0A5N6L4C6_9ROSI|nr:hypothetical protein FH972_026550 [Carpinus fangiana]